MQRNAITRITAKLLLPFILLFALYVQCHGDFGPGGGFQAGVIFAVAYVLYAMVFGLKAAQQLFPRRLAEVLSAAGVAIYGGVGVVTLVAGGMYLDYGTLAHDRRHGQHLGIFLVELGVGIAVAATMLCMFYAFAARKTAREDLTQ